jgi:zinc/manganese transport system ATP-binding protein
LPRIGYLPQRRSFDANLRIRGIDVVRMGLDGDRWGVPLPFPSARRRAARARVDEVIELVGASAYAHRPIGQANTATAPPGPVWTTRAPDKCVGPTGPR